MVSRDADVLWTVANDLARAAAEVSRAEGCASPALPPLLFFTDPERTPRPWETAARLPPGAGVVYRHFGAPDARQVAERLHQATARRGILLLIGDDAALAEAVGADGVHLPERALARAADLARRHPGWRLTGAWHVDSAERPPDALDAVVLSPVFDAGGASPARLSLGADGFSRRVRTMSLPVYALGGIDATNAAELKGSGAVGLAGVSAIRSAFGP